VVSDSAYSARLQKPDHQNSLQTLRNMAGLTSRQKSVEAVVIQIRSVAVG
jgi:hypothetical protein